jgi:hypothetical protein
MSDQLIITRKLIIETLLKEFKIKIQPFGEQVSKLINLEDYDVMDILFYISMFFNGSDLKNDINTMFDMHDIKTSDNNKLKEIMHEFLLKLRSI